jgi:pyruvate formate lyase activating enzyme
MPDEAVKEAIKHECKSIAFTYSEPTTYFEYVYDTAILARENHLKTVIKTSGYINEEPLRNLCKVIDAANVDLKSFSNKIYMKLSAGKLDPVLDSLIVLKEEGVWLEITNLIIPSWTDDLDMIKKMCNWLVENGFEHNPLHFNRFYPNYKLTRLPSTPLNSLLSAADIAKNEGLLHVYVDSIPGLEESDTSCPGCGRILVKRRGYRVIRNEITDSQCSFCGTEIHGIWT